MIANITISKFTKVEILETMGENCICIFISTIDAQQTSLGSDDPISRQQIDALDTLINKSDTSSRLIPYLYANI